MPHTPRRRVAIGISRRGHSLIGRVQVGTGPDAWEEEKPFDLGTPMKEIQQWRQRRRLEMLAERPNVARGSLEADVRTYLERVQKREASWPAKRSELRAWVALFGTLRRHQLKPEHIDQAIHAWLSDGVAKKTVLNRCRTLHHLFVTLANDRKVRTPLDQVDVPRPEKRRPPDVPDAVIVRTERHMAQVVRAATALVRRKPKRWREAVEAARARARFMVLASTGIRPSQMMRVERVDVDLRGRVVAIGGGKGGEPIIHALNAEMHAAWSAFVAADAFGPYDPSKFRRRLVAAGWPAGVKPYALKHTVGFRLAEAGADHEDIKDWYGHSDTKTTRIYVGVSASRVRRMSASIDQRFGWAPARPGAHPGAHPGAGRGTARKPADSRRKSRRTKTA